MNCPDVRSRLLDLQRDRLAPGLRREMASHLETCAACTRANEEERALSELLQLRLPRYPASPELKSRLVQFAAPAAAPTLAAALVLATGALVQAVSRIRWMRLAAPALAMVLVAGTAVLVERSRTGEAGVLASMTAEAVNDHLRILNSAHPLDIESSAHHQVKPWFAGKLDFAPLVPELSALDLRLEGGAVGYFFDRKAAVVVYALGRHTVTMIEFRAGGLRWPPPGGRREAFHASDRGFHAVFWRSGELCYVVVSDVDPQALDALAARLASN